jgi:chorismate synthase
VSTFGESHGIGVGVVIDGCPPKLAITPELIQAELDRRRPGQSKLVTQRQESDKVEILSGLNSDGLTLGTPIALLVRNSDARSRDYDEMRTKYRPSHADFAYDQKFGIRAAEGGGRASARETIGRVAAGAIAQEILRQLGVSVCSFVKSIRTIEASCEPTSITRDMVELNAVRCPDPLAAEKMIELIETTRKAGDSVGGVIECCVQGVPPGWGEPVFGKLEAELAKAMLSIPACKGFEVGDGFALAGLTGTEANDMFYPVTKDGKKTAATRTNRSGGIQGGISNGMPIVFRAIFKPTATVLHPQETVTTKFESTTLSGKGRHDACVLPRAVPIVDAMASLVLTDAAMLHTARQKLLE